MTSDAEEQPGVGPHPRPWPDDPRLDPELLAEGDRRNVVDRTATGASRRSSPTSTRGGTRSTSRSRTGSTTSTSARSSATRTRSSPPRCTSSGRRRWNRRGAMVTDRYQHVRHHEDVDGLRGGRRARPPDHRDRQPARLRPAGATDLPRACVLLFGQEGPGLSRGWRARAARSSAHPQYGSTRSINAGVASGVAMYEWIGVTPSDPAVNRAQHRALPELDREVALLRGSRSSTLAHSLLFVVLESTLEDRGASARCVQA